MASRHLTPQEQLRLHMWITAAALGLLRHGEQDLGRDIQLAAEDYRSRPSGVRRVLLNEEPLYVAGHILGMDVTEVDNLPEDVDETAPYTLRALDPRSTLGR